MASVQIILESISNRVQAGSSASQGGSILPIAKSKGKGSQTIETTGSFIVSTLSSDPGGIAGSPAVNFWSITVPSGADVIAAFGATPDVDGFQRRLLGGGTYSFSVSETGEKVAVKNA